MYEAMTIRVTVPGEGELDYPLAGVIPLLCENEWKWIYDSASSRAEVTENGTVYHLSLPFRMHVIGATDAYVSFALRLFVMYGIRGMRLLEPG